MFHVIIRLQLPTLIFFRYDHFATHGVHTPPLEGYFQGWGGVYKLRPPIADIFNIFRFGCGERGRKRPGRWPGGQFFLKTEGAGYARWRLWGGGQLLRGCLQGGGGGGLNIFFRGRNSHQEMQLCKIFWIAISVRKGRTWAIAVWRGSYKSLFLPNSGCVFFFSAGKWRDSVLNFGSSKFGDGHVANPLSTL